MTKTKIYHVILICLIVWGILLRLWSLGKVPVGLNRDEAALGYNAFAIANFGVDEWNRRLPIIFESFGDYKLPGYIYTLAPIIKILGVHDWVVRLPSVLAGIGLIFLAFLITQYISKNRTMGLLAAALVALSPWAIFYSRTAFEAHLGLMWLVVTIYLVMIQKRSWQVGVIGITYFLAVFTYNTPLLLLPVLILFVASLPQRTWANKLILAGPFVMVGVLAFWMFKPLTAQKQNITIFSDPTIASQIATNYTQATKGTGKLLATKYVTWGKISLINSVKTAGPSFLVIRGGSHPWHSIPGTGHLFWVTYILFWLAVALILLKKTASWRLASSFLILSFGAILPAIVTVDAPHATRSLLFLYLIPIIASLSWGKIKKWGWLIMGIMIIESLIYTRAYFWIYPNLEVKPYPVGFEEITRKIGRLTQKGEEVMITQPPDSHNDVMADQPYIWFLLYEKISPDDYETTREIGGRDAAGMIRVKRFGNYVIRNEQAKIDTKGLVVYKMPNNSYIPATEL